MRTASRRGETAFTIIELMIVVTLTAAGLVALLKMQSQSIKALAGTRNFSEAVNLAEHFIETLKLEAMEWTTDGTSMVADTARFPNLHLIGNPSPGGTSGWQQAMVPGDTLKTVGTLGNDSVLDSGLLSEFPWDRNRRFCVHFRLTWLIPDYLMRVDVRVVWMREDSRQDLYQACPVTMISDQANVGYVSVPAAVMRNVFTR